MAALISIMEAVPPTMAGLGPPVTPKNMRVTTTPTRHIPPPPPRPPRPRRPSATILYPAPPPPPAAGVAEPPSTSTVPAAVPNTVRKAVGKHPAQDIPAVTASQVVARMGNLALIRAGNSLWAAFPKNVQIFGVAVTMKLTPSS